MSKLPGSWFFGVTGAHGAEGAVRVGAIIAMFLVYAGIVVMIGSWLEIVRTLRRHPNTSLRAVAAILFAWAAPILVMPPLFSRDVYSYAAQGQMVSRGINPFVHGPSVLGPSRFLGLVDPLWRRSSAPYGPAWERLSGLIVQLADHDVLTAVILFRLVALVGVSLIAWGVPRLARSVSRDQAGAFALAVLNPLVLLVLLGGAHNDALMLGLLVAGCALARSKHVVTGLILCALAAEILVPALIGVAFIAWWWSDGASTLTRRGSRVAVAILFSIGVMVLVSALCGLGWRWLSGLSDPGLVVSWLDPATAVGLALGHLAGLLHDRGQSPAFVQGSRMASLGLAAIISVGLILRSRRIGAMQAIGWSLLAFAILGPIVWPWYETWGFVFLAVVAEAWTLRILVMLSALACFADVPDARYFWPADPILVFSALACLIAVIVAYGLVRLRPSMKWCSHPEPILPPTDSDHLTLWRSRDR